MSRVEEEGCVHDAFDFGVIERRVILPFGCNNDGVGAGCGGDRRVSEREGIVGVDFFGVCEADGVMENDVRAEGDEFVCEVNGRGISHVVGIGFEGEAEEGDFFAADNFEFVLNLTNDAIFLVFVDIPCGFDDGHIIAVVTTDLQQRLDVFWEA